MTWPHAYSFSRRVPLRFTSCAPFTTAAPLAPEPVLHSPRRRAPITEALPRWPTRAHLIIHEVAAAHGIGPGDVRAGSRLREHVIARQEAMHRLRTERRLSLPQIARALGLKDHTTVLHGLRAYAKRVGEGA